jgi:hypothetical protein
MSRWRLVLNKDIGLVDLETFNTRKQAEEAIEYRNTLTRHLGYDPDIKYEIIKVKSKKSD